MLKPLHASSARVWPRTQRVRSVQRALVVSFWLWASSVQLPSHAAAQLATAPEALSAALQAEHCLASEVLEFEQRWYVACGAQGVLVLRPADGQTFVVIERRALDGEARALFVRNGQLWVEAHQVAARPLAELRPATPGATAELPTPVAPPPLSPPSAAPSAPQPSAEPHQATPRAVESVVAPERVAGIVALEASLRPMLPIGELAFAGLGELAASYRGRRAWYAQARLFPLGGLVGKGRDVGLFGALLCGGYDHPLFSIGLGFGALRRGDVSYDWDSQAMRERVQRDESVALIISQSARLGALDGLSLTVTNAFVLDDERWRFGFVDVALQVPTGRRTWITAGGGGAEQAGYFYAELGLRRLVWGDRRSGSLFVRPSVGAAGVDRRSDDDWVPGPMVGVHLEWRR